MIVFLIQTYWFFNKHKIFLWFSLSAIVLAFSFFISKLNIEINQIQFLALPFLLMMLLMAWLFRNMVNSLAGMLPVLFGGALACIIISAFNSDISHAAFIIGSAITLFTCSYSIFTIRLLGTKENFEVILKEAIISLTQRSLTTSTPFFCLMLTGHDLLQEIGFYVFISVLGASLFSLVFLPHLINRGKPSDTKARQGLLDKIALYPFHYGLIPVIIILLISAGFLIGIGNNTFEKEVYSDSLFYLYMIIIPLGLAYFYGRIELVIIVSLPLFTGWLWTSGLMDLFGLSSDTLDIFLPALIFGLGAEFSILTIRGLIQDYKFGAGEFISGKAFVLLSFITGIISVGALLLLKNSEMNSLALILTSGLLVVLLVCFTIQPALFRFLTLAKSGKRRKPMSFSDFIFTVIAFSVFIGGCLTLNLLLPFILILPVRRKVKKVIMHYMMMGLCRFEVYLMFNVKKKIINISKEDLRKPALILSNHQSHIDLLLLLMLHPKMIVITNKWVWNNPVYSIVIRYLDFYNISDGYEKIIKKLENRIKDGYSILIFPEGSRSEDTKITRFHKGAFVVAEQLNLEIVPIIIHGVGDCMNKGENFLKSGTITMKIYGRIKPSDTSYGNDYSERAKSILKFYRSEYVKMVEEYGTPKYYGKKIARNFIYKGPVLEWYSRIKIKQENNYELFNNLLPRDAVIIDMGCGYGFLSFVLGIVSERRKITGVDYDRNKIEIAKNCVSRNENICFVHSDILKYEITKSDAFILLDVLHYFNEEKQEQLIVNCINNLNENGMIIIRDAEQSLKRRHRGTIYTELFSSFTGFNIRKTDKYFFTSKEKIREITCNHRMTMQIIDHSWFTSNLIYVIRKKSKYE
ncbi:MAG: 1-acyl-sn-glycerol-3-phosphate acyltransferase [Bacteroidota bacterium]